MVEQAGRIRVLENGKLRAQPFLDIRSQVSSGGERGCSSVAFHPNYAKNHRFYVDYTDRNGDTRVVEYRSERRARRSRRRAQQLLFVDQPYANHNGGRLAVRPGRAALRRHGRRRLRRRPGEPRAEPARRARQARCGSIRASRGAKPEIVGLRPAQPVALLVRPADRRPLHRRRRPGRLGGDRLHGRAQSAGSRTTAGTSTRGARASRTRPLGPAAQLVCPIVAYSHDAGLLGHRRLRLPRQGRPGRARAATSSATTARQRSGA